MSKRLVPVLVAIAALVAYAGLYYFGWTWVWRVPEHERDGMEGMLVFLLTLPWCLLGSTLGRAALHAGAVVNGTVFAGVAAWNVRTWVRRTGG